MGAGARRRGRWGVGLGAGREGVWQALGMRGRAGRRCRQLGARARGAAGALACGADGARGRQGALAVGAQGGKCAGGRRAGARVMRGKARGRGAAGRAELAGHRRCARGHARPGRGLVRWLG